MAYTGASTKQIDYAAKKHPGLIRCVEYVADRASEFGFNEEDQEGVKRVVAAVRGLTDARTVLDLVNVCGDEFNCAHVFVVALGFHNGSGLGLGKSAVAAAKSLLAN